jgi:hypothetical protein
MKLVTYLCDASIISSLLIYFASFHILISAICKKMLFIYAKEGGSLHNCRKRLHIYMYPSSYLI